MLKDFPDLLFEASNAQMLAEKIKALKSKTEQERTLLGEELRAYSVKNFMMKQFIDEHEKLYKNMTNS